MADENNRKGRRGSSGSIAVNATAHFHVSLRIRLPIRPPVMTGEVDKKKKLASALVRLATEASGPRLCLSNLSPTGRQGNRGLIMFRCSTSHASLHERRQAQSILCSPTS